MNRTCLTPEETFALGEEIGRSLDSGDLVLLFGGLGAGKTLLSKGILNTLDFNIDEVTSPSFTLVNLYKTSKFDVYHIDLWRLENAEDAASTVGLEEILENPRAVAIIEWSERLTRHIEAKRTIKIAIDGDGDDPRSITIIYT